MPQKTDTKEGANRNATPQTMPNMGEAEVRPSDQSGPKAAAPRATTPCFRGIFQVPLSRSRKTKGMRRTPPLLRRGQRGRPSSAASRRTAYHAAGAHGEAWIAPSPIRPWGQKRETGTSRAEDERVRQAREMRVGASLTPAKSSRERFLYAPESRRPGRARDSPMIRYFSKGRNHAGPQQEGHEKMHNANFHRHGRIELRRQRSRQSYTGTGCLASGFLTSRSQFDFEARPWTFEPQAAWSCFPHRFMARRPRARPTAIAVHGIRTKGQSSFFRSRGALRPHCSFPSAHKSYMFRPIQEARDSLAAWH